MTTLKLSKMFRCTEDERYRVDGWNPDNRMWFPVETFELYEDAVLYAEDTAAQGEHYDYTKVRVVDRTDGGELRRWRSIGYGE